MGYEEARTEQEEADKCKSAAHTEQAAQGQVGAIGGVVGHQTPSGPWADGWNQLEGDAAHDSINVWR